MPLSLKSSRAVESLGARFVIVVLLFAVAGLATLAKNGQYFPSANPAHQVSISTKLNVASARVSLAIDDVQPAIPVALAMPLFTVTPLEPFEPSLPSRLASTISMQHRSPPLA